MLACRLIRFLTQPAYLMKNIVVRGEMMLVTQQRVLRNFWYPVLPSEQLQTEPQSFELLGQKIALWRDREGNAAAVSDRCCHRSAQLSRGVVIAGHLQCPYHGWTFDRTGTCVNVPQLADQMLSPTYCVPAYHVTQRYGYIWVCLGDPLFALPAIPEADDPRFRLIPEFYEAWQCSGLRVMENSFDNAHFSFVHHATFGDHHDPIPASLEIIDLADGLRMKSVVPVVNPPLQQQNLGIAADKTVRTMDARWFMPFARALSITYPNGLIHIIFTAATPINDRTSQIVQFCLRNDTEAEAKATDIIAFDRAVTREDQAILETTDYDTPLALDQEQHMPSDKPGMIMRHKLAALLKAHGEVEITSAPRA
jgi:phenylpropionate dioxygenase-like ring-hydroxylating dioxygenase large terminal subunit